MSIRKISLLPLVLLASFFAVVGGAHATTYCVNAPSSCTLNPENSYPGTQQGLADALNATNENYNRDTVIIGPGTIDIDSPLAFATTAEQNTLDIIGTGPGQTLLDVTVDGGVGLDIADILGQTSTMSGLTVRISGNSTGARTGLQVEGVAVEDVDFKVEGSTAFSTTGMAIGNAASCNYCDFTISGTAAAGASATNPTTSSNNRFVGTSGAGPLVGIRNTSTLFTRRSHFSGLDQSVLIEDGTGWLYDSVIDLGSRAGAVGIRVSKPSNQVGPVSTLIDGLTIVGEGAGQIGVDAEAVTNHLVGEQVSVSIVNSLLKMDALSYSCHQGLAPSTVNIGLSYNLIGMGAVTGACSFTASYNTVSTGWSRESLFVNWPARDFRPAPGSPAIDAANPDSALGGRTYDAIGGLRLVDDPVADNAAIDMGAIEYQPWPPDMPSVGASATSVLLGSPIDFTAQSIDGNDDALTYHWDFDDGAESDEQNPTHTFTTAGTYEVEVWANDGALQSLPGTITITVLPIPLVDPPVPPAPPAQPTPDPTLTFGKFNKKIKFKKKAKLASGFKVAKKKPKGASLKVVASEKISGTIKLLSKKGKALKGSQKITLRAGTTYLSFRGKWNRKKLKAGKYTLRFSSVSLKDARKSVLNVVR